MGGTFCSAGLCNLHLRLPWPLRFLAGEVLDLARGKADLILICTTASTHEPDGQLLERYVTTEAIAWVVVRSIFLQEKSGTTTRDKPVSGQPQSLVHLDIRGDRITRSRTTWLRGKRVRTTPGKVAARRADLAVVHLREHVEHLVRPTPRTV
jgi:hypothetical protein